MPEMTVLVKPVSGLCNMSCSYCFYRDEMEKRENASCGVMTAEVMEQVVKKTLDFASSRCTFLFQGGEPTLAGIPFYEQWLAHEKNYNRHQVEIFHAIQTNGYLVNEAWCRFWAEKGFLVGLSVDGVKSTHDVFRKDAQGNGTYLKVLEAAHCLHMSELDFNVLTVVNSSTAPKIQRIYETYQMQGFVWQQYIACLDPLHEESGKEEYSVTPEQYGQSLIELFELWAADFWKGRQPYIRQFENYIGILLGVEPESCEQRGTCGFQNVVEADGSVYPCDFYVLDEYKIGNLAEDDFWIIEERRKKSGFVEDSCRLDRECAQCGYFKICRGGCRRHRELPEGGLGRNYFCRAYQIFFDACLPEMKRIAGWAARISERQIYSGTD